VRGIRLFLISRGGTTLGTSQIGIKIADGSFYPVLDEGSLDKKRLIVTTVKDNQHNVQIDLYRSQEKSLKNAEYIGSLLIEDIPSSPKGEPEVEVIIGVDEEGNLNAVASENTTGNRQSLSTGLENLGKEDQYGIPEFALDEEDDLESFMEDEDQELTGTAYPLQTEDRRRSHLERKSNPVLRILFILLGILIIAGLTYLIFQLVNPQTKATPLEVGAATEQKQEPEKQSPEKTAEPVKETTKTATDTGQTGAIAQTGTTTQGSGPGTTTVTPEKKTADTSTEGVWYTIRRGDTLWDISNSFYRNPWLYKKIATHPKNRIKDPDFILAGFKLFIPKI
ncbi:MAG TPA: Hsp70 family protein, partial [Spirochaetia bacterium]|nr:Hsp70 family protein [Spirochaetia bacterium]